MILRTLLFGSLCHIPKHRRKSVIGMQIKLKIGVTACDLPPVERLPCGGKLGAIGFALDFKVWRAMVRTQGMSDEQAIELMVGMVRCTTDGAGAE